MASPQKENGYTSIANEILEHIVKIRLSGIQLSIVLMVWRYTYGFGRKEAELTDSYLANALGIRRNNLNRDIQPLFKMNILKVIRRGTKDGTRSILAFNKNYNEWVLSKQITGIKTDTTSAIRIDKKPVIKSDTQKRKSKQKKIIKKESSEAPVSTVKVSSSDKTKPKVYGKNSRVSLSESNLQHLYQVADKIKPKKSLLTYIGIVDNWGFTRNKHKLGVAAVEKAMREDWDYPKSLQQNTSIPSDEAYNEDF